MRELQEHFVNKTPKCRKDSRGISFCEVSLTHWYLVDVAQTHDDVIKWKHFPRYWPFVRGIHRSPVNSPHNAQWRGALMFSLISARVNGWVSNREAGDLRRHRTHYDVIVMRKCLILPVHLRSWYCEYCWWDCRQLLKQPPSWKFVHQFVQANNKGNN